MTIFIKANSDHFHLFLFSSLQRQSADQIINIECRAWAKNIIYSGSHRDRQVSGWGRLNDIFHAHWPTSVDSFWLFLSSLPPPGLGSLRADDWCSQIGNRIRARLRHAKISHLPHQRSFLTLFLRHPDDTRRGLEALDNPRWIVREFSHHFLLDF